MMPTSDNRWLVPALAAAMLVCFARDSYAYLDPGSGSFVFQVVVGALLAFVATFRGTWKRLTSAVKEVFRR